MESREPEPRAKLSRQKSACCGASASSNVDCMRSIQNATGRTSALIAVACVGLIAADRMTDASFTRLLQVSALLFFIGAIIGGLAIRNSIVHAEPVPDEVTAPAPQFASSTPSPNTV